MCVCVVVFEGPGPPLPPLLTPRASFSQTSRLCLIQSYFITKFRTRPLNTRVSRLIRLPLSPQSRGSLLDAAITSNNDNDSS